MKPHIIEWKHLVQKGRTCNCRGDRGETLRTVIRELNAACDAKKADGLEVTERF